MKSIKLLVMWFLLTGVCTSIAWDSPFEDEHMGGKGNAHINVHGEKEEGEEEVRRHMGLDREVPLMRG